jgi:hypothetical protein
MIESEFVEIISTVGFPIAMCFYFIFKFEKTIKSNTEATNSLISFLKK